MGYVAENEDGIFPEVHSALVAAVVTAVESISNTKVPLSTDIVPQRELEQFTTVVSFVLSDIQGIHTSRHQGTEQLLGIAAHRERLEIHLIKLSSSVRNIAAQIAKASDFSQIQLEAYLFEQVARAAMPHGLTFEVTTKEYGCEFNFAVE